MPAIFHVFKVRLPGVHTERSFKSRETSCVPLLLRAHPRGTVDIFKSFYAWLLSRKKNGVYHTTKKYAELVLIWI